tara:strand:- start:657 stop:1757 length:1101 start_codon:yes stop_codon:yes gene_type:complete
MSYYLIPFFFLAGLTYIESSNKLNNFLSNKYLYPLVALFFIFFIGFRNEIGCDWDSYIKMFEKYSSLNLWDLLRYNFVKNHYGFNVYTTIQELGHVVLSIFSKNIYFLNLLYSILFVGPLFYFCSKANRVYLTLLISYPYFIIVVGMGPVRQAACISLLMSSIFFVSKKKHFFHFLATTFSLLIHQFSILFNFLIVLPFLPNLKKNKFSKKNILFFSILLLVFLYNLPIFISKLYFYITVDEIAISNSSLIIWLINFFPSLIFLNNIQSFKFESNLNKIFVILSIFEILILPFVFFKSVIAYRLLLYLFPSSIFISSHIPDSLNFKIKETYLVSIITGIAFASLIVWLRFSYHASCWVPYKNILFN